MLSQGRRRRRRGRSIRSLSATRPCGCSSEVEPPAFNRQARVRCPAPAPPERCGVVEWPQTPAFEAGDVGSSPTAAAITPALSSEAEQRSYKAKVDVCTRVACGLRPVALQRPDWLRRSERNRQGLPTIQTSVAQRQERDSPKVEAGGSSPPGRAKPNSPVKRPGSRSGGPLTSRSEVMRTPKEATHAPTPQPCAATRHPGHAPGVDLARVGRDTQEVRSNDKQDGRW